MAKIKHTKNELKAQAEALSRYQRFLPMLQLKKQQLQVELQTVDQSISRQAAKLERTRDRLRRWVRLFSEPVELPKLLSVRDIAKAENNIAGVTVPVLEKITFDRSELDLFETPAWWDDAQDMGERLMRLEIEREILDEQRRLIGEELRITTQRVNLFEKVKIPECKENIRVIKIFLGDEQTAGVVRAKLAKGRTEEYELKDAAAGIAGDGIQ